MFQWICFHGKGSALSQVQLENLIDYIQKRHSAWISKSPKFLLKLTVQKSYQSNEHLISRARRTVVEYAYPWLPPRCTACEKWGHLQAVCLAKAGTTTESVKQSSTVTEAIETISQISETVVKDMEKTIISEKSNVDKVVEEEEWSQSWT